MSGRVGSSRAQQEVDFSSFHGQGTWRNTGEGSQPQVPQGRDPGVRKDWAQLRLAAWTGRFNKHSQTCYGHASRKRPRQICVIMLMSSSTWQVIAIIKAHTSAQCTQVASDGRSRCATRRNELDVRPGPHEDVGESGMSASAQSCMRH